MSRTSAAHVPFLPIIHLRKQEIPHPVELKDGAVYLQEAEQTAAYTMVARDLQQVAMSPEQSREVIGEMLKR